MRALVTGGAGFLGSHLVDLLRAEGHDAVVLDDLSTGRVENLSVHRGDPRVILETGDVRDRALVARHVERADVVFHLAGAVGVRRVAEDPAGTWSRNVEGTASVLEACARGGTRCLVASTSEAYGPTAAGTLCEDHPVVLDPAGRRDVYGVSKVAGESLAIALHRTSLLPVTVVRPFNVVGPRQSARYGMVLPRFAAAAVRGEPLTVHGDGRQTRTFLHVADAVAALLLLAACTGSEGLLVNLGSEEEVAIADLARLVVAVAGSAAPLRFVPFSDVYGPGFVDPLTRRPDVSLLRRLTGFSPRLRLADAVADAVRSAREATAAPV